MGRKLAMVAAALAVLAGMWITIELRRPKPWSAGGFEVPIIGDIRSIEVTHDGETWRVEREGSAGEWQLVAPWRFPANDAYVETITSLFDDVDRPVRDLVRPAAEAGSALGFAEGSGVDAPIRVTITGASESVTLRIGNTTTVEATARTLTWVAPEGDSSIYRVGADLRSPFDHDAASMRDRNLVSMSEESITAVTLDGPAGRVELRRTGDHWTLEGSAASLDEELVSRLVRGLSNIRASAIDDDVSRADAGLETPSNRVTVSAGDRSVTLALGARIAATDEAAPRAYAAVDGLDVVFVISGAAADRVATQIGDLTDRSVLDIDRGEADTLTIDDGGVTATFVSTQADCTDAGSGCDASALTWSIDGAAAEAPSLAALVAKVSALEALRWSTGVESAAAGLDTPRRTLRLRLRVGVEHVVELGADVPSESPDSAPVWARLDGGPVFELSPTDGAVLLTPIETLRGAGSTP